MAKKGQSFNIGFILLNVGLLGFISDASYLAYIGLIGSLLLFVEAFAAQERIAKQEKSEDTVITNYSLGGKPMTKESKIVLAVTVLSTILLMGLQLYLHRQSLGVTLGTARAVKQAVEATPSASPTVAPSASASASGKAKATATPKATVKPTETPEASEQPAE